VERWKGGKEAEGKSPLAGNSVFRRLGCGFSAVEEGVGVFDIAGDLDSQGGDGWEFHLIAEFCDESDFEFLPIEIVGGGEDVGFDTEPRGGLGEGWADADIEDGSMGLVLVVGMDGVDAVGGEDEAGDIEVGGGEAEFSAELISGDDGAREGVGTAEHFAGLIEFSGANGLTDAGAADGLVIEGDGG